MNNLGAQITTGLGAAWSAIITFVPKLLLFLAILVIGYFIAKLVARVVDKLLERVGFDRWVERGAVKKALDRTKWDASSILGMIVFYFIMLFTLQIAFGIFGPNPVSDLLARFVTYIPNIFVAAVIIVIAGAVANAVRQVLHASLGGLSYGNFLARATEVLIWAVGIFAALNQLNIAPAIVNGLFYAILAVIAGSAIVAIGGGGIAPMRAQWEKTIHRVERETTPRVSTEATPGAVERAQAEAQAAQPQPTAEEERERVHTAPRFTR